MELLEKYTFKHIYIVVVRHYEKDLIRYTEDIVGTTEDLTIANALATNEKNYYEKEYNITCKELPSNDFGGVEYALRMSVLWSRVYVDRISHFTNK